MFSKKNIIAICLCFLFLMWCQEDSNFGEDYKNIWSKQQNLPQIKIPYWMDFELQIWNQNKTWNIISIFSSWNIKYDNAKTEKIDFWLSGNLKDDEDQNKIDINCTRISTNPKTYFQCSKINIQNTWNYQQNILSNMFYDKTWIFFHIQNDYDFGFINRYLNLHNIYNKINNLTNFFVDDSIFVFDTWYIQKSRNPFLQNKVVYNLQINDFFVENINQIMEDLGFNKVKKSDILFSWNFLANWPQSILNITNITSKNNDYICHGSFGLLESEFICKNPKISETIKIKTKKNNKISWIEENKYFEPKYKEFTNIFLEITNWDNLISINWFLYQKEPLFANWKFKFSFSDDGIVFDNIESYFDLKINQSKIDNTNNTIPQESIIIEELFADDF